MLLLIIFFVIIIGYLVAVKICSKKEGMVTALYMKHKVYTRHYAYIFMTFFLGSLFFLLAPLAALQVVASATIFEMIVALLAGLCAAGVFLLPAYLMYGRAKKRCPIELQKKLLTSMLVTGLGVTYKLCFFFVPGIWDLPDISDKQIDQSRHE